MSRATCLVDGGLTAVLVSTSPFWMVGIEALMRDGEPLTARRVAGLLVGVAVNVAAGVLLVVLGLIALHVERAFPVGDGPFSRKKFGFVNSGGTSTSRSYSASSPSSDVTTRFAASTDSTCSRWNVPSKSSTTPA